MERPLTTPHQVLNPTDLPQPRGYSQVVIAQSGRTVYLAGQTAQGADGTLVAGTLAEQFDVAAANVVRALKAARAVPNDLVSMQIFVTDVDEYLGSRDVIGQTYRRHFGTHYPAMALFEVRRLFDPGAKVELMCVAVTA
jgi:enamine deaminase RidA (YjgF/YER057c/UK114 family)